MKALKVSAADTGPAGVSAIGQQWGWASAADIGAGGRRGVHISWCMDQLVTRRGACISWRPAGGHALAGDQQGGMHQLATSRGACISW